MSKSSLSSLLTAIMFVFTSEVTRIVELSLQHPYKFSEIGEISRYLDLALKASGRRLLLCFLNKLNKPKRSKLDRVLLNQSRHLARNTINSYNQAK